MFKLPPDYQRRAGSPRVLAANFAGGVKAATSVTPSPLAGLLRNSLIVIL
ncbi:hypothetical protein NKG95_14405 [Mesorhizobium sp. M1423]